VRIAFVANLGLSDVAVNVGSDLSPFFTSLGREEPRRLLLHFLGLEGDAGAREAGRVLLQRYEELRSRITLPLLDPSLREVRRHAGRAPDRLVLVATDQPDPDHRKWDTLELAKVCERWLRDHGYESADIQIAYVQFNPSSNDRAGPYMEKLLRNLRREGFTSIYAAIRGGPPALVGALREQAVNVLGAHAYLIEVDERPWPVHAAGQPGPVRLLSSWPFRRPQVSRMVEALLDRHDYPGALQLMQREQCLTPAAGAALRYALNRLNLAFQDARDHARALPEGHPLRGLLEELPDRTSPGMLQEVVVAARVAYDRNDWSGFVVRVASFCEYTRWLVVYLATGVELDQEGRLSEETLRDLNKRIPRLREVVPSDARLDRKFYHEVFTALKQEGGAQAERIAAIERVLAPLRSLEKLRHQTVHRLRGISEDELRGHMAKALKRNPQAVLESAATEVLQHLRALPQEPQPRTPRHSPQEVYQRIREFVLAEIEGREEVLPCAAS